MAAAQSLGPGEEHHQLSIVGLAPLHGPPGKVVKCLEIPRQCGRLGPGATVGDVDARGGGSLEQEQEDEDHGL